MWRRRCGTKTNQSVKTNPIEVTWDINGQKPQIPIAIQMAKRSQVPLSSCIIRKTLMNRLVMGRKGSRGTYKEKVRDNDQTYQSTLHGPVLIFSCGNHKPYTSLLSPHTSPSSHFGISWYLDVTEGENTPVTELTVP